MNRRGFTLVEMMIAVVLTGIVTGAVFKLLWSNQRVYRQQTERVAMQGNTRAGVGIVRRELRELNSADPLGSDITSMGASSVTYKAMRTLFVLCQPPVVAGASGTLTVWSTSVRGIRGIDHGRDSVLLYAEGDPTTETDNRWVHANISAAVTIGTACPGARPSITISVNSISPANTLGSVLNGSAGRTFETMQLFAYGDAAGQWWLGSRRYAKLGGWSATEPVLGPLSGAGLHLTYYNAAGVVTAIPAQVARIGVALVGRTTEPVSLGGGQQVYLRDSLVTDIALRNVPR